MICSSEGQSIFEILNIVLFMLYFQFNEATKVILSFMQLSCNVTALVAFAFYDIVDSISRKVIRQGNYRYRGIS